MDYIIFKICLLSSCFGWVWADLLTVNRGLFDFIPKYYPKILATPLGCPFCLAGWTAIFTTIIVCIYAKTGFVESFFYTLFAPMLAMYLVAIIKR